MKSVKKNPYHLRFSLVLGAVRVRSFKCSSLRLVETERLEGMLELVSLNGNVVRDENGKLFHHTHALFSFKKEGQHGMAGGHLKATTVLYTAEIELRPTIGGAIGRKFDPETGTGFWDFK